ncbi:tRNA1(Val) (adenine(37)-N6)-methyltransferase [bacterium MnTg02]|nr:tRNA1(Val) (adenine(37)-N6)-methyltransferase [bacterium MnTg02]
MRDHMDTTVRNIGASCTTDDAFLGGRLQILQPAKGLRAGIDPVFLAAATHAKSGERILEAGVGVAVASLCLATRVPDLGITGVELQSELCELATENVQRNGLARSIHILEGDIAASAKSWCEAGLLPESFDHVIANPPYYDSRKTRRALDPVKECAHVCNDGSLEQWVRFMVRLARPKARITLIHKADALPQLLNLLQNRIGDIEIHPLFPAEDSPASRIIVSGTKGSRGPLNICPGIVLHQPDGGYTAQAQRILRDAKAY